MIRVRILLACLMTGIVITLSAATATAQEQVHASLEITYPVITAVTAGVLTLLQMLLMLSVGMTRLKYTQGIGDGGYTDLARQIRRHGNLAENAAIFLVVLALLEMSGTSQLAVMVLSILFVLARFSHAIAFSITEGPHPLRAIGAMLTALLGMITSGYLIWSVL